MLLKVRVTVGAKKELVAAKGVGTLVLHVREKAEANQANKRVLALVAAHCKVATNNVRIVSGHHSPSKLVEVRLGPVA